MKAKLFYLVGLVILCIGCESTQIPCIEGEWTLVDKKNPFSVVITENMIHAYAYPNPTKTLSCKYTMSQDYLHIVRLWKSETDIDYTADCKYSFKGDTLIICDFLPTIAATYPPTYNDIKLVKKDRNSIPLVVLDSLNKSLLDEVFCDYNLKLRDLKEDSVYIISSQEELQSIYPDYIETLPTIDFSKNCIVFTYVVRPSISDILLGVDMRYNQNNGLEFIVTFQECTSCYTAIWKAYPYGVYRMPYNGEAISLQKIIL